MRRSPAPSSAGGQVTASANLFYYAMRNAQRRENRDPCSGQLPASASPTCSTCRRRTATAPKPSSSWRPNGRLTGRLALGFLRDRIDRAGPDISKSGQGIRALAPFHWRRGGRLAGRPRLKLLAQGRYHSAYYSDDSGSLGVRVGPATIIDVRAEYRMNRYSLFAYARNLFDSFALIKRFPNQGTAEDPRMVGAGIEARF